MAVKLRRPAGPPEDFAVLLTWEDCNHLNEALPDDPIVDKILKQWYRQKGISDGDYE